MVISIFEDTDSQSPSRYPKPMCVCVSMKQHIFIFITFTGNEEVFAFSLWFLQVFLPRESARG